MNYGKVIYGNKMKVNKNTICYTSEVGHNNFWYPTSDRVMVKKGCVAKQLAWIGGGNMIAIKILKSCLVPINITKNTTDNSCPPSRNDYTIVWLEKNK